MDNAIRYGGNVEVALDQINGMARIQISDDGPGLSEDHIHRVFEPFVRLESSRNRDTGGTGLGLAIARTIIQSHGGEIVLSNRPEGGLLATVRIPLMAT